jgi:hypothetical protein
MSGVAAIMRLVWLLVGFCWHAKDCVVDSGDRQSVAERPGWNGYFHFPLPISGVSLKRGTSVEHLSCSC